MMKKGWMVVVLALSFFLVNLSVGGDRALAFMISGMGGWNPILDTISLPYLFRDLDHADRVINGPLWEEQNRRLVEKSGRGSPPPSSSR